MYQPIPGLCVAFLLTCVSLDAAETAVFIEQGNPKDLRTEGADWKQSGGSFACGGYGNFLFGGKSVEGSLTCFLAVLCSAYAVTGDAPRSALIAGIATVTEALPSKDADNILLPTVVGLAAVFIFGLA